MSHAYLFIQVAVLVQILYDPLGYAAASYFPDLDKVY